MRGIIKNMFFLACIFAALECNAGHDCDCAKKCQDKALESLFSGNKEFVKNPKFAKERKPLVKGQNPHVIMLSCADSRVPPETIFQQGLGDLFVVRSAGQVADLVVVDSIEYAVRTFDSCIIIVMAHTDCGAVSGALGRLQRNNGVIDPINGHLNAVLIPIETAIVEAGIDIYAPDALKQSTRANVRYIVNELISQSIPIEEAIAEKRLKIIGAEYHLDSGKVKKLFTVK
jgi:carbonic anhydrase